MDPRDVVSLSSALVRARSDGPPAHERPVLDLLLDVFGGAGACCIEQPVGLPDERCNLLVLPSRTGVEKLDSFKNGLLFSSHMDVVSPGDVAGWPADPFDPWIDGDGCLHGRGATDMKGGLAATVVSFLDCHDALEAAQRQGRLVALLFTVDEEVSLAGARAFCASPLATAFDKVIVPEPTGLLAVRGHKGVLFIEVTARGKAAHGSVPERGVNAISIAMQTCRSLERDFTINAAKHVHPVLGAPTMNVGCINGGSAPNIVPESCTFAIDRRVTGGEDIGGVVERVASVLASCAIPPGGSLNHAAINARPPYLLDESNGFLNQIEGKLGKARVMNGYTEAGIFHQAGLSPIVLGPGSIDQAHVADEKVDVQALARAVDIYKDIMMVHVAGGVEP